MKTAYLYICAALATCLLSACVESHRDFDDYVPSLKVHTLSLNHNGSYSLPATASKIQLAVFAEETSWAFTGATNWLSINPQTGNSNAIVTLQTTENTSTRDARTCQVTFRSMDPDYKNEVNFSITQSAAAPFITPSQTRLTFTAAASQQTISITTNCSWTASTDQDWIHVTADAAGNKVVVEAEMNITNSQREATIVLTGEGGKTVTIDVEQKTFGSTTTFSVYNNGKNVTFKMIRVGTGTFQMGSNSGDSKEQPVHQVTLTKDYYIGETEVTQALWYAVMGQSPTSDWESWISKCGLGDNYPAYDISYEDCQQFLTKLNQLTGQQFRFPTEAEWEFAARGGTKSKRYTYAGSNTIDYVAWSGENSFYKGFSSPDYGTHKVKTKNANELGIYDMSGNVDECCADWYSTYSSNTQKDPTGPTTGYERVFRGGSWIDGASGCTVSSRSSASQSYRGGSCGFRLAL